MDVHLSTGRDIKCSSYLTCEIANALQMAVARGHHKCMMMTIMIVMMMMMIMVMHSRPEEILMRAWPLGQTLVRKKTLTFRLLYSALEVNRESVRVSHAEV